VAYLSHGMAWHLVSLCSASSPCRPTHGPVFPIARQSMHPSVCASGCCYPTGWGLSRLNCLRLVPRNTTPPQAIDRRPQTPLRMAPLVHTPTGGYCNVRRSPQRVAPGAYSAPGPVSPQVRPAVTLRTAFLVRFQPLPLRAHNLADPDQLDGFLSRAEADQRFVQRQLALSSMLVEGLGRAS
jgi:hypothetical protein